MWRISWQWRTSICSRGFSICVVFVELEWHSTAHTPLKAITDLRCPESPYSGYMTEVFLSDFGPKCQNFIECPKFNMFFPKTLSGCHAAKFHQNRSISFRVILLTNKQTDERMWKHVPRILRLEKVIRASFAVGARVCLLLTNFKKGRWVHVIQELILEVKRAE